MIDPVIDLVLGSFLQKLIFILKRNHPRVNKIRARGRPKMYVETHTVNCTNTCTHSHTHTHITHTSPPPPTTKTTHRPGTPKMNFCNI